MPDQPSVLLVDDDEVFRETLARELRRHFGSVREADSGAAGLAEIEAAEPDVLLLDLNLGDASGLDVLAEVRARYPSVEVVMVTAFGTVDSAVEAMRAGAFDFVVKPFKLEEVVETIRRAGERRGLRRENVGMRRMLRRREPAGLIGESEAMRALRADAERAGPSDAPVLIVGPSGSGKELVARMIHGAGPRAKRELVTVNCAALQESLLESELFGHERGAFTGATEQRPGLVETAHGTSLFLDEVGELPLALQAKLLRAIQFGEIRRVGGVSHIRVDVRIIAATNRDLAVAVREGTFREDLYYRLNVLSVSVPPLREHAEDIPELVTAIARRLGLGYELDERHLDILRAYPWPGNVRELENLMERLKIRESDGPPSTARLRELLGPLMEAPVAAVRPLAEIERDAIEAALRHYGGDRKAAAEALGISVRTLYYRMATYRGEE